MMKLRDLERSIENNLIAYIPPQDPLDMFRRYTVRCRSDWSVALFLEGLPEEEDDEAIIGTPFDLRSTFLVWDMGELELWRSFIYDDYMLGINSALYQHAAISMGCLDKISAAGMDELYFHGLLEVY